MQTRTIYPIESILFLSCFVFFFFMSPSMYAFPDVFWHLNAGKEIIDKGYIPQYDSWAYTTKNFEWYNISWLYDVLIAWVHNNWGDDGLFIFDVLLFSAVINIVFISCTDRKVSLESALIVCFLVAMVLYLRVTARPQIISFLLAPLFYLLCHRSKSNEKLLYALPLIMILWVNTHGGFLTAYIILGACILEAFIDKNLNRLKCLAFVTLSCILAMFINPIGADIIEAVARTINTPMRQYIIEWMPVKMFVYIGVTLYVLVFILVNDVKNKKISTADKIIAFGWLLLGLHSMRLFTLFVLLSCPYVAQCINSFKHEKNKEFAKMAYDKSKSLKTMFGAIFCVAVFSWVTLGEETTFKKHYSENGSIQKEVNFVMENYPNKNVMNFYDYGGEISFHSKGKLKVFLDGRNHTAFPLVVVEDYLNLIHKKISIDELSKKYGFDVVIAPTNDSISSFAKSSKNWKNVMSGSNASVFVKKSL